MSYILYYNLQLACVWKLENLTRCTRIAASIALNDESYVGIELLWQLKRSAQQEIKKVLRFETADTFDDQQHYRHCLQMKALSGNASKLLHNVTNFVLCTSPGAILLNAIKVKYGQYFQKYQIHFPTSGSHPLSINHEADLLFSSGTTLALVDRPTQLICTFLLHLSCSMTKLKEHSREFRYTCTHLASFVFPDF